jgi:hypothetical protein
MNRPRHRTTKPRLCLQVELSDQEQLRQLAKSLGFLVPSGTNTGQGSISALVTAIANARAQDKLIIDLGNDRPN